MRAALWLSGTVFLPLLVLCFVGVDQGDTSIFGSDSHIHEFMHDSNAHIQVEREHIEGVGANSVIPLVPGRSPNLGLRIPFPEHPPRSGRAAYRVARRQVAGGDRNDVEPSAVLTDVRIR